MILYGASGHGKVIIDILERMGITDIAVWDDADKEPIWQYPVTRPGAPADDRVVIGIGINATRRKVALRLGDGVHYATPVHPAAWVSPRAVVGEGTVVMAGAIVNPDARIGRHCIINTSASVDHDCIVGDYAHLSPNATLCGDVQVGEGSWVGAGATVIQGIHIGKWCMVGAGAVVIADVPDHATVVGNPARIIKTKQADE
jgi:sugar O-acyltransferase (sialic acid O-acetyltransferase NeuD family)